MKQETMTALWCRDRLFVKLAKPGIAQDQRIRLTRFPYKPREKLRLPPVGLGCAVDTDNLAGMMAVRFGMLLAAINVQAGLVQ